MAEMDRAELRDYLLEHDIPFHRSAHIDVLRELYLNHLNDVNLERNDEVVMVDDKAANVVVNQNIMAEEAAFNAELRVLELRQRIVQLRRELADSVGHTSELSDQPVLQPSFTDIQHSIIPFSGTDSYDAHKWLADFERACASINGNDVFKLKCVRRLMKPDSDAEIFLRTDNSVTYHEFRSHFLQTFGHIYSVSEVIDKLNNTKFRPSEMTIMGYILRMQEIAARADVDEKHTVRCIIDGFRDRSVNIAVLYPAQNLQQLKELARSYQHLRDRSAASVSASIPKSVPTSVPDAKPTAVKSMGSDVVNCFNCSGKGHIASMCPLP